MGADERFHVGGPVDPREALVEHELGDPRRGLDLDLENVRLQRAEEPLLQQVAQRLICDRLGGLDERVVCDTPGAPESSVR